MLIPLAAIAFSATACKQEPVSKPELEKVTLTASVEGTRTSLGENGTVLWSASDSFDLLDATDMSGTPQEFTLTSGAGSTVAEFEGMLPSDNALIGVYAWSMYYSVVEPNTVGVYLQAAQPYVNASFASKYNPMVAYYEPAQGGNIMFRNVCGLVEFRITGTGTLSNMRISCGDKVMAGGMHVQVLPEEITIVDVVEQNTAITITDINTPLSEDTPLSVYCVMMPGTYENMTIVMTDTEGNTVTKTAATPITVERAVVTPVQNIVFDNVVAPALEVTVDETRSDCFQTWLDISLTGSQTADSFVFLFLSDYDGSIGEWLAAMGDPVRALIETGYSNEGKWTLGFSAFPGKRSVYAFLALNGGEPVGGVVTFEHTAPEMVLDETLNVSVSAEITEPSILNVTVDITGNATTLYSSVWADGVLDGLTEEELASVIVSNAPMYDVTGLSNYSYPLEVPEGQTVDIVAMTKGENGYSRPVKYEYYIPVVPGEDSEEYRRFIGTWTVTGQDGMNGGSIAFQITVEEDVVGKTYRVSGLANYAYGIDFDDTVVARFDGANIYFDYGIITAGTYEGMSVMMRPMQYDAGTDTYMVVQKYVGTYVDGNVSFAGVEIGYDMVDTNSTTRFGQCFNMVWSPAGSTPTSSSTTESFLYAEPVNVVWQ